MHTFAAGARNRYVNGTSVLSIVERPVVIRALPHCWQGLCAGLNGYEVLSMTG